MRRRDFLRLTALAGAAATTRAQSAVAPKRAARVIVVGGGFAGSSCCARDAAPRSADRGDADRRGRSLRDVSDEQRSAGWIAHDRLAVGRSRGTSARGSAIRARPRRCSRRASATCANGGRRELSPTIVSSSRPASAFCGERRKATTHPRRPKCRMHGMRAGRRSCSPRACARWTTAAPSPSACPPD